MKICNPLKKIFGVSFIVFSLVSCNTETSSENEIPISELSEFETIISVEDEVLASPASLKYNRDSTLFVFDQGLGKVIELKESGEVVREYGRMGRGPGEFQRVNNIYITDNYLFVIDPGKFAIHKFGRHGELQSTFDFGNSENQSSAVPPPPPMGLSVSAKDINNQPAITQDGNVLLSAIRLADSTEAIFQRVSWEGEQLSSVGEIPEGSTFILNNEKIRDDVNNRVIPTYYRANAFPVNDPSNPGDLFLVYSDLPKIMKYNSGGEKLWESNIPSVSEIDSVTNHFFPAMERLQRADIRNRIRLEYYSAGVSDTDGNLYLAMDRNPVWIHKFNKEGNLIMRYKIISPNVTMEPIFDLDSDNRRFLIVTEESEVRAYSY